MRRPDCVPQAPFGTPEHLDRTLSVTTPRAWIALGAILVTLTAIAIWSVMGTLGTYVQAEGIILGRGGLVVDVTSVRNGTLTRILLDVGDRVEQGEPVAETYDLEVVQRYRDAVATLEERRDELHGHEVAIAAQLSLLEANVAGQRVRADTLRQVAEHLLTEAREHLANVRMLAEERVVSRASVEAAEQRVNSAQRSLFDAMTRRDQLEAETLSSRARLNEVLTGAVTEYNAARRRVDEITSIIEEWKIRSPLSGRVAEVKSQVGSSIAAGDPVLSVETGEEGLEVRIFVPPVDGKRVREGMPVLVSPRTVRREEYGVMKGTVAAISEFPASLAGIVSLLHNEDLATSFARAGPPYPGRVALVPDSTTVSGVAWSSPRGGTVDITPGTLATVEIQVARNPPITMVLPWVKGLLSR